MEKKKKDKQGFGENLNQSFIILVEYDSKFDNENPFPQPFKLVYVSSDMRIVPCCMEANPDAKDLGDANKFSEEWGADEYQQFRKSHIEGDIPNFCKSCYK